MRKLIIKGQHGLSNDLQKIKLRSDVDLYMQNQNQQYINDYAHNVEMKLQAFDRRQNWKNFGLNAISTAAGFYDVIPTADDDINATDSDVAQLRGKTALMMMQSGNPWLMAAGATVGVLDKTDAFGDATEGLGGLNDFGNAAMAYLAPGIGWMKGLETDKYNMSEALGTSSSYSDTRNLAEKALKNAGSRFLFGRKKANNMIADAKLQDYQALNILGQAKDDFAIQNNMSEINGLRILNVTSGGNQMFRAAKHGMKMSPTKELIEKAKNVISNRKNKINFDPYPTYEDFLIKSNLDPNSVDLMTLFNTKDDLKDWKQKVSKYFLPNHPLFGNDSIYNSEKLKGGKRYKDSEGKEHYSPSDFVKGQHSKEEIQNYIKNNYPDIILEWDNPQKFLKGGQMNVIPEGALHARLHHMEDVNPDLKGQITKKGIPVVSEGEGGEIEQQAEIEREEIIFNKEVTSALEELYKKYQETPKPEYALYAGKILALQIMENTDDRTGLIQRVV